MAYNTNLYIILFLPITALVYQLMPAKYRWQTLLIASILFFWSFSKYLIIWTILITALTYFGGLLIQRVEDQNAAKPKEIRLKHAALNKKTWHIALIFIVGILAILGGLKYFNFSIGILNKLFQKAGSTVMLNQKNIAAPIGLSFYSLQAIGYLLDVHWKRFRAETNFFKLLLFILFFPTLMEGPIMKWQDMKDQLFKGDAITMDNLSIGLIRIFWGLFKRMMISDRMNNMVTVLFDTNRSFNGAMIFVTGVVVTIQLYMEFSGTIDIVIGSARIFNIKLMENFRQPFLAENAAEFWRRWHISLGEWFKSYIFYPVSTSKLVKKWNKFGRKHVGNYLTNLGISAIALFPVWMLNGLWHGPQSTYILYGVYYFIILLIGTAIEPLEKKFLNTIHVEWKAAAPKIYRRIRTFLIIITGETLFRCTSFAQFIGMMSRLFQRGSGIFSGKLLKLGVDQGDLVVIVISSIVVFLVNYQLEKHPDLFEKIPELSLPKRWAIYYAVLLAIMIFGAYGTGYQPVNLIYAGF